MARKITCPEWCKVLHKEQEFRDLMLLSKSELAKRVYFAELKLQGPELPNNLPPWITRLIWTGGFIEGFTENI